MSSGLFSLIRTTVGKIPTGKVATYGMIAQAAGFPGAARQVAWALHNCARPLPWHRVVGAGGKILLRGNLGMEQKLRLESEGVVFHKGRISLADYGFFFEVRK